MGLSKYYFLIIVFLCGFLSFPVYSDDDEPKGKIKCLASFTQAFKCIRKNFVDRKLIFANGDSYYLSIEGLKSTENFIRGNLNLKTDVHLYYRPPELEAIITFDISKQSFELVFLNGSGDSNARIRIELTLWILSAIGSDSANLAKDYYLKSMTEMFKSIPEFGRINSISAWYEFSSKDELNHIVNIRVDPKNDMLRPLIEKTDKYFFEFQLRYFNTSSAENINFDLTAVSEIKGRPELGIFPQIVLDENNRVLYFDNMELLTEKSDSQDRMKIKSLQKVVRQAFFNIILAHLEYWRTLKEENNFERKTFFEKELVLDFTHKEKGEAGKAKIGQFNKTLIISATYNPYKNNYDFEALEQLKSFFDIEIKDRSSLNSSRFKFLEQLFTSVCGKRRNSTSAPANVTLF